MEPTIDEIRAQEASIDSRLQALEARKISLGKRIIDLRSIKVPGDLAHFHAQLHQEALQRNSNLLQELDIATGKLHTQALFPMQQKLFALRKAYLSTIPTAKTKV